jgi:hypothetical protein
LSNDLIGEGGDDMDEGELKLELYTDTTPDSAPTARYEELEFEQLARAELHVPSVCSK